MMMRNLKTTVWAAAGVLGLAVLIAAPAVADQVFLDDVIVDGSLCVGFDCVNGESFGFDTIRLKENNLRIHFQDTSSSASFPTVDWRIRINDSANGGGSYFAVEDASAGRTPFLVEANAPTNALYLDDGGRLGLGTSIPVADVHIVSGNTPTLRLEQDGSSGFAAQTWDVAGNEANFFIRDVTNGSTLPFRIRPGAPTSAIDLAGDGDIGIGTASPQAPLHVFRSSANSKILIEDSQTGSAARTLLELKNTNGNQSIFRLNDGDAGVWDFKVTLGGFIINKVSPDATAGNEMLLGENGDMTIQGDIFTSSCSPCTSDYVFEDGYELMPLDAVKAFIEANGHLPNLPSEADFQKEGRVGIHSQQKRLLEKIEELTLYTLDQEAQIRSMAAEKADLTERLAALEKVVSKLEEQ
jgi:hypothetical protein